MVVLRKQISSLANKMFAYKPVRDGILVVHTVRYPAVRIVVDHRLQQLFHYKNDPFVTFSEFKIELISLADIILFISLISETDNLPVISSQRSME